MFLMSLAIADLTVGTIVMPISSAYAITGRQSWRLAVTSSTLSLFRLQANYSPRFFAPLRHACGQSPGRGR